MFCLEKKNAALEHEIKDLSIEIDHKAFAEDDDFFYFGGYGAIFGNVDFGGDVIVKGAFAVSLKERMPKLCYQHNTHDPIGVVTECSEDGKGLRFKAKMPKDNQHCKDVSALIKCRALDSMSIGYSTIDSEYSEGKRYLKQIELYEISPVTFPMNPLAMIDSKAAVPFQTDLAMCDKSAAWDSAAAVKRIREWAGASEEPNEKYVKAFLWFDPKKKDDFAAYKLPICDVVDGEMKVVPRAVFAAAGALKGAEMSKADIEAVKANISRYYKKLGMDAPWDDDKAMSVAAIHAIETMKEVNEFLRTYGMNNDERMTLISKIKAMSDEHRNGSEDVTIRNEEVAELLAQTTQNLKAIAGQN